MTSTRRMFVRSAIGVAAAATAGSLLTDTAFADTPPPPGRLSTAGAARAQRDAARVQPGARSANGWTVNTASDAGGSVWTRPIPGTGCEVQVAIGDVEIILVHCVRRFHYEIESLRPGDVVGFKSPGTVKGHASNHASGTALDIRPGSYPPGVRGGFHPYQVDVIRDILAECDGVVTWGGDFRIPDEAHFEIGLAPADPRVHRLADKLRDWRINRPGQGAGVLVDPMNAARRAAALTLARTQAA
ncbi:MULTISPECIES: M15 family metallopeptidase [unclassified Streptomyces]|uniref:M15 family metallopeptidase n=1 Tax=unclassified Streptomyces TaxID=2593676 RepID=UPI002E2AD05B|nr:M15 family metallopeptidase [Streptomyces sp. NBC_00223]